MKKIIQVLFIISALLVIGCEGDDKYFVEDPEEETAQEETQTETEACKNPALTKIACTSARRIDGLLDPEPYAVADWIYSRAKAANGQCREYSDIVWIYQEAMRALNSGDSPNKVKFWFLETMEAVVNYRPTEEVV